ncbi:hypothetical protein HXX76_001737 [Chlamydomonas incerta]|uniref:Uncharacterized protein n=1 Tax=Chlamydomonas incerta TaxID=51695 RepID=A0A835TQ67_CHLIN|nr:hypothetical protein HXX76_001737 [Chlamydomonas incerta]|eukprot:KAG2443376.1 hypothetical protein HXX76_001737 [Chlamydomonas incerta]
MRNGKLSVWYDTVGTQGGTKVFEQANTFLTTNSFACPDYGSFTFLNPTTAALDLRSFDIRNLTVFESPALFSTELYADTLRCRKLAVLGASNVSVAGSVTAASYCNLTWDMVQSKPAFATVATSGNYSDLSNKPTIPAAQVNSDWLATTGVARVLNRPSHTTYAPTLSLASDPYTTYLTATFSDRCLGCITVTTLRTDQPAFYKTYQQNYEVAWQGNVGSPLITTRRLESGVAGLISMDWYYDSTSKGAMLTY